MQPLLARLFQNHGHRRLQVLDAVSNVGIARAHRGVAVAFEIHRPDVVAVAGELIHQRVFAMPRNIEVEARPGRDRRSVHQKQHRERLFTWFRRAHALAEHVELHVAALRPIFVTPDGYFRSGRRGARDRGLVGSVKRRRAASKTERPDPASECWRRPQNSQSVEKRTAGRARIQDSHDRVLARLRYSRSAAFRKAER